MSETWDVVIPHLIQRQFGALKCVPAQCSHLDDGHPVRESIVRDYLLGLESGRAMNQISSVDHDR